MSNKIFFQLIAIVALAVTIVLLFSSSHLYGPMVYKLLFTGGTFVIASALSLLADRREDSSRDE